MVTEDIVVVVKRVLMIELVVLKMGLYFLVVVGVWVVMYGVGGCP